MFSEEEEEEEEEEEVLRSSGVWGWFDQWKLSRFITYWTLYILLDNNRRGERKLLT
ncbi:hypothetical protein ABOD99_02315 [Mycoplasmoides gallisepticum]|uniref:hypothetical protein n=1 Tax=Mycoplasmoides gallisepticum TaxID=2096 RepID=UPI003305F768